MILSTLGIIFFTKILTNRTIKRAGKYNVYIEVQSGFRENISTVYNSYTSRHDDDTNLF